MKPIDKQSFEKLMLDPVLRKQWDMQLSEYYEVKHTGRKVYYSMFAFPFPFKNRDFLDTVTVKLTNQRLTLIFYSTDECEIKTKNERGTTLFSVIHVQYHDSLMDITAVGQLDLKLPFTQHLFLGYAVAFADKWCRTLIHMIETTGTNFPCNT
jgi:hypothetical protein